MKVKTHKLSNYDTVEFTMDGVRIFSKTENVIFLSDRQFKSLQKLQKRFWQESYNARKDELKQLIKEAE